jgi:hypothetical protein
MLPLLKFWFISDNTQLILFTCKTLELKLNTATRQSQLDITMLHAIKTGDQYLLTQMMGGKRGFES